MLATTTTFIGTIRGANRVVVEVDIRNGLPSFSLVGLEPNLVRETRERVRAAILNEGFDFPQRRITVNLSFSDPTRSITPLDLPIAAAILKASGQIDCNIREIPMLGELSLDGSIRACHGLLTAAEGARDAGSGCLVAPQANVGEARLSGHPVSAIARLGELKDPNFPLPGLDVEPQATSEDYTRGADLKDLRGHGSSIRLLRIAAAGRHNLMLIGPPGCGRTMLARRLPSILPPMTHDESIAATRIASIGGLLRRDQALPNRPFRAPHYSVSRVGLYGSSNANGGYPGELNFAHAGVLFLDEINEFSSQALTAVADSNRTKTTTLSFHGDEVVIPADAQLVGASSPCRCGRLPDLCHCDSVVKNLYARRLAFSAQFFDMFGTVSRPTPDEVADGPLTDSATVRADVIAAREIQAIRYADIPDVSCNGDLDDVQTMDYIDLTQDAHDELALGYDSGKLDPSERFRHIRVARTMADLEGAPKVCASHVISAGNTISYFNIPQLVESEG